MGVSQNQLRLAAIAAGLVLTSTAALAASAEKARHCS